MDCRIERELNPSERICNSLVEPSTHYSIILYNVDQIDTYIQSK